MAKNERRLTPINQALRSRLTRDLPYIGYWLFPALNRKLPTVTVRIVKPEAHVRRAGPFRSDFIARIFQISLDALQVVECFSQRRHVWQMKGHVIDRFRRRLAFEQRDRDVVVTDSNAISEFEFLFEPQRALKPFRAFLRIAHRSSEVT